MAFPHRLVMHRPVTVHDARLGYRLLPSLRVRVPHERGCHWLCTNRDGFRCERELDAPRIPGRPRVLVIGDSFTAGDGVDEHERFSDLLGAWHDLEVFNLALPGTAPDQHALLLEEYAPRLAPDFVWIAVTVHTIARIQTAHRITTNRLGAPVRRPRAWFELDGDGLALRGVPVPETEEPLAARPALPLDPPWRTALTDRFDAALGERGRAGRDRWRARAAGVWRRFAQRALSAELDPDYLDADGPGWQLLTRILRRCIAAAGKARVVIAPIPTAAYVVDRLAPRYSAHFARLDAPEDGRYVVDVTAALAAQRLESAYTFRRDAHPSPVGHRAIASALSESLVARGLLPPPTRRDLPQPRRPAGDPRAMLVVGWDDGAYARVTLAGRVVAAVREDEVGAPYTCHGALPYAAIGACLERGGLDGSELASIELAAPRPLAHVLAAATTAEELAPYVRWYGAAERDVRRLLAYDGPVRHTAESPRSSATGLGAESYAVDAACAARPPLAPSPPMPLERTTLAGDAESVWIIHALAPLLRTPPGPQKVRRFERVCRRWEAATRRARRAGLP